MYSFDRLDSVVDALVDLHASNAAGVGTVRRGKRIKGYAGGIAASDARRVARRVAASPDLSWQTYHARAVVCGVRQRLASHPHPVKVWADLSHLGGWTIVVDLAD